MKIDEFGKILELGFPRTTEDQDRIREYMRSMGIDPSNFYQELEMSSRFVNTHRDTTYSNELLSLHSHEYFEILFCVGRGVEYLVGSERYRLQKGDIIIVPPGVSHRPILPELMTEPYVRDVIWISAEFMDQVGSVFGWASDDGQQQLEPIRTAGTRWEWLGELFHAGVEEETRKAPGWEGAVIGNTMTILANLNRIYHDRTMGTMHAEKPELLDRIAAYIEEHYAEHITVGDVSRQFYVSSSTVSHLFRQKMGVSIYRYVTQRRLIAAKKLIRQKCPMEDVAHRVGFVDYSTFYRAFKQEYGISPRKFSQQ